MIENKVNSIPLKTYYVHEAPIDRCIDGLKLIAMFCMWFLVVTLMCHLEAPSMKDLLSQLPGAHCKCCNSQSFRDCLRGRLSPHQAFSWGNWHLVLYRCWVLHPGCKGEHPWRTRLPPELLGVTGVHPKHTSVNVPHAQHSLEYATTSGSRWSVLCLTKPGKVKNCFS